MATTLISVQEYLSNPRYAYSEYLDGVVKEKPMVSRVHGVLVALICSWFVDHAQDWGVLPGPEVHTRIASARFRLPDVSVTVASDRSPYNLQPPFIAIEVLSPGYSLEELTEKLADYAKINILNVWVIDPEKRKGWLAEGIRLVPCDLFSVKDSPIYLDLGDLFARHDRLTQMRPPNR